ncbi:MAG: hypothetical protein HYY06_20200 [Deltaproteobacteria bacterium]|nr:hypothetical protein [Deltaproteobacteria bacterium]
MRLSVLVALCLNPSSVAADSMIDIVEHAFGASNVHAISGNGRLTVGVSREGDITVLTWPSPSFTDQLAYLTSNAPDARDLPRFGAAEGMGAFSGIVTSTDGGKTLHVTWLGDPRSSRTIGYASDSSSAIVVATVLEEIGLEVEQTLVVLPDSDVLERRVRIVRSPGSPVTDAWLLEYENLSPTLSRVDQIPLMDWAFEPRNDYAALYDGSREAILHFRPDEGTIADLGDLVITPSLEYAALRETLAGAVVSDAQVDALTAAPDDLFAPGVYLAFATDPPPDQHQVGFDRTPICDALDVLADNVLALPDNFPEIGTPPIDPSLAEFLRCTGDPLEEAREDGGWVYEAEDALADAGDGSLSGSRIAAAQVNAALRAPIAFDEEGVGEARMLLAAGPTAAEAWSALEAALAEPFDDAEARADDRTASFLVPAAMPPTDDADLVAFCRRTLLNILVGTDASSGAIMASITRQPPYGEDWPRDGAFFDAALDVAGLSDVVTKHLRFYASVQREEPAEPTPILNPEGPGDPDDPGDRRYPADTWEMNYYADGRTGGHIRFEVDETALLVWSFVRHSGYVPDARAWLEEVWPNVERAANLLARWRDPATGLVWFASEDDNMTFTQGLQGAGTVFLALREAARAAAFLGHDEDSDRWLVRAGELRAAILEYLYDDEVGFLGEPIASNPGSTYGGPAAWIAWPAELLPPDDPRIVAQLRRDLDVMLEHVRGETEGSAYVTKTALAAAMTFAEGPEREKALEIATRMATRIAEPDTRQLGEVFRSIDDDGDGVAERFSNRVATPHLWAATLVYLTAMAVHAPERFDLHEDVLPDVVVPEVPVPPLPEDAGVTDGGPGDGGQPPGADAGAGFEARGSGCGCRAAGAHREPAALLLSSALACLALARRRP